MSTNAQRLAEKVKARREELDLSQLDVWQAGGPSNTTLTEIENGRLVKLTRTTARRIDIGLRWEPGSARQVWDGGDPIEARPNEDSDGLEDLRRRILAASFLTAEEKAEVLATLDRKAQQPPTGEVRGA